MPSLSRLKAIEIMEQAEAINDDLLLPLNDAVLWAAGKGGEVKSRPQDISYFVWETTLRKKHFINHVLGRKSKKRELPPRTMVLLLLPQAQMEKTWTKMALHSLVAQMLVSVVCVCLVQD